MSNTRRQTASALRWEACRARAHRARWTARVLIPVTLLTLSTAIWSEPALRSEVERGLDMMKPIVQGVAEGKSLTQAVTEAAASPDGNAAQSETSSLPRSMVPINRPDGDGT